MNTNGDSIITEMTLRNVRDIIINGEVDLRNHGFSALDKFRSPEMIDKNAANLYWPMKKIPHPYTYFDGQIFYKKEQV